MITREETYLNVIASGEGNPPDPITREELFLAKLAGSDVPTPEPITRKEYLLKECIEHGGGGGISGGFNVTFKVDNADYYFGSCGNGGSISAPPQPTKTGKVFVGWSLTDGGEIISFPYTVDEDKNLYAVFTEYECTIAGLGNSDTSTVTFTEQGTFPSFEEVTVNGNVFIKIPTIYRNIYASGTKVTGFSISTKKLNSSYVPYPCFINTEEKEILPYVLIGKYLVSSNDIPNSVESASPTEFTNGNGPAIALGAGYRYFHWSMYILIRDLMLCKSKNINFNDGTGITSYMGICQLNYRTRLNGVSFKYNGGSSQSYYARFYTQMGDDTAYTELKSGSSGDNLPTPFVFNSGTIISELYYNSKSPFANFAGAVNTTATASQYFCDKNEGGISSWSTSSTYTRSEVYSNIGEASEKYGLFYQYKNVSQGSNVMGYTRLCYCPIGE